MIHASARRRGWRPDPVACLEGRALLAASPFDPTFGTGGTVIGSPVVFPITTSPSASVTALALQSDGKIVTAEVGTPASSSSTTLNPLVIRRYAANGTLDTTFGTGGTTIIPFSGTTSVIKTVPTDLIVQTDGTILVAAEATTGTTSGGGTTAQDVVARLTNKGALDSSFGTNGEYVLPTSVTGVRTVAVEGNGRILVAGVLATGSGTTTTSEPVVVGLTAAGAIDTTFGTNGQVAVPLARGQVTSATATYQPTGLAVASTGQVLLSVVATGNSSGGTALTASTLSQLTAAGAIDTTFGTNNSGTIDLTSSIRINDVVPETNGKVLLAGSRQQTIGTTTSTVPALVQLNANGTTDTTFNTRPYLFGSTGAFQAAVIGASGLITAVDGSDVFRYQSDGNRDLSFGTYGRTRVPGTTSAMSSTKYTFGSLAVTTSGNVLIGGQFDYSSSSPFAFSSAAALAQILPIRIIYPTNDYNGDGKSDIAAELTQFAAFAYRTSTGDTVQPFGAPGAGQAIPAPGDYDGDGKADIAAYLPAFGVLAYRPSSGGADVLTTFGPAGVGNAIPVPGDYDGDGKTDVALYLPGSGVFAIDPSSGAAPYAVTFGAAGTGNSIPAPGDYDGDGRTDIAVYLPASGAFAIDPSSGATPYAVSFGALGAGNTIPAPGDYDGDGVTDIAAYLPQYGVYAYRPSSNTGDVLTIFGPAGSGAAIPVPGDYDGDGKADVALYLPGSGAYAIDPSSGAAPYAVPFGQPGAGDTIPATAVVVSQDTTVSTMSLADSGAPGAADSVPVYLPDDLPETARKKANA